MDSSRPISEDRHESERILRESYGINAVRVRNEIVHLECRTDEDMSLTVIMLGDYRGACDRCGEEIR